MSATAFGLAIVAFITGDRSDQTLGTLTAGAIGVLTFVVTQAGRYAQAHAREKTVVAIAATAPPPKAPIRPVPPAGG